MATLTMTVTSFGASSWPPEDGMSLIGSSPPNEILVVRYPPAGNNVFGTVAHGYGSATIYIGEDRFSTLVDQVSSPQTLSVTITYTPATPPSGQYVSNLEGTLT